MTMNRIINNADLVVEDMLKGWLVAHADTVVATDNSRVVKRARAPEAGKVGVVTGGGSGHEPAFLGYVGDGMSMRSPSARSSRRRPPRASSTPCAPPTAGPVSPVCTATTPATT